MSSFLLLLLLFASGAHTENLINETEGDVDSEYTEDHHKSITTLPEALHDWQNHGYIDIAPKNNIALSIGFHLRHIIDLNTEKQILKTSFKFSAEWLDPRLVAKFTDISWKETDHFKISRDRVWLPTIEIENEVTTMKSENLLALGSPKPVRVYKDGRVAAFNNIVASTHCAANMQQFPFDQHICTIMIDAKSFQDDRLEIGDNIVAEVYSVFYVENTAWILLNVSISKEGEGADVHILLQRRPNYSMLFLGLPLVILVHLSMMQYLIASGPVIRCSLGVTSLLALTVFLGLVKNEHPPSEELSVMAEYLGMCSAIMMLNLLISILVSNYSCLQPHNGHDEAEMFEILPSKVTLFVVISWLGFLRRHADRKMIREGFKIHQLKALRRKKKQRKNQQLLLRASTSERNEMADDEQISSNVDLITMLSNGQIKQQQTASNVWQYDRQLQMNERPLLSKPLTTSTNADAQSLIGYDYMRTVTIESRRLCGATIDSIFGILFYILFIVLSFNQIVLPYFAVRARYHNAEKGATTSDSF